MDHQKNEISNFKELYVVGVGASAGGLDAISKFLANYNGVSAEFCVVIVMHLSPDYKSELTSILAKRCKWPVTTVTNNLLMQPRTIYITPQNCDLHVEDDSLVLDTLPKGYSHAPSIDNFFTSLALAKKNKALGIILSGFGKDGTKGIQRIKENFGFTIAQLPETAEHRDMPKAAINSGKIDVIIPAEQMYDEIVQFINNSNTIANSQPSQKSVDAIFSLLEKRSGTDFSLYKPTTIMRRINHRIDSLRLKSIVDYYEMIKGNPKELDVLFETVLIGVTEFFRDTKAFESLRKHLADMLTTKKTGDSIRIWCVGCATGEEPYSIGILLHELLGTSVNQYYIQIFASDIDERALNFARKGIYRKESLKNMDEHLIDTYFTEKDPSHYELNKEIKQHTLFNRHDISNDPPFVKLDLVVCRNLLIYFNNELQKQSLQIFHYSLKPQGLLFLGKSESISQVSDLFKKSDSNKIFTKAEASLNYELRFSRFKTQKYLKSQEGNGSQKVRNMSLVDAAKETLYHKYQHPFVIINDNAEIKQVHGSLRLYLEISQGTMNANLHKMANPELTSVLKGVHAQVRKTGVQHVSHVIKFNLYDNDHFVRISITPLIYQIQDARYYIVVFEKVEPSEQVLELQKKLDTSDFVDLRIKELEDELATNKEHLQIFTEELEATNEELQTINEELQSANEELKSSNEELETSNEELQSANEELNTANYELRVTNEAYIEKELELKEEKKVSELNEQIYRTISENIPDGTVGILNTDFEIEYIAGKGLRDFKPEELIGLYMPGINPLESERKKLKDLCEIAISGKQASIEIGYEGRYYNVKAVPFKLSENTPTKIMYLTQEITVLKNNQILLNTALKASNLIIFNYDFKKKIYIPNKPLSEFLELSEDIELTEEIVEELIHPQDRVIRRKSLKKAKKTGEIKHELRFKLSGGIKYARVSGRLQLNDDGKPFQSFATLLDITEDVNLLQRVKESEEHFRKLAELVPEKINKANAQGKIIYYNESWIKYTGASQEVLKEKGLLNYIHPEQKFKVLRKWKNALDSGNDFEMEMRLLNFKGEYCWHLMRAILVKEEMGKAAFWIGATTQIHKLKEGEKKKGEFLQMVSHELKTPVTSIKGYTQFLLGVLEESRDIKLETVPIIPSLKRIDNQISRLTRLISEILDLSRIEGSKMVLHKEIINLNQLVDHCIQDIKYSNDGCIIEVEHLDHFKVKGDIDRLEQVIINCITNALKYSPDGEKIEIKIFRSSDICGSVSVKDRGIGIHENDLKNIFKRFYRVSQKNEDTYSGFGIGLFLVKEILDRHNGSIEVKSKLGEGSEFIFTLPTLTEM